MALADDVRRRNEATSAREVAEWRSHPPRDYFVYIDRKRGVATTWMGDVLGHVSFGRAWRDNFGSTRVPIEVRGNNGHLYSGTYFESAGDYARIHHVKRCQQGSCSGVGRERRRHPHGRATRRTESARHPGRRRTR